jgi:CheY-like chemotaxis protein
MLRLDELEARGGDPSGDPRGQLTGTSSSQRLRGGCSGHITSNSVGFGPHFREVAGRVTVPESMERDREHPVILVAEDDEADVALLQRAFRLAGIVAPVHFVSDGEETVAYLKGEGKFARREEFPLPDLLLLDLNMPRKDGFQVIQWIRHQQPDLAALRVVVLTTSDALRDINRAYQLGANSFLTKPLVFTEFKDTIQAMYHYWMEVSKTPDIERPPASNPWLAPPAR